MLSNKILKKTRQQSIWNRWGTYIWKKIISNEFCMFFVTIGRKLQNALPRLMNQIWRHREHSTLDHTQNPKQFTRTRTRSQCTHTNTKNIVLPKVNSETGKKAFSFQGAKVFNKLTLEMKTETSILQFKTICNNFNVDF